MGRPPAYIFVVRHGNRLDAADKQWHLSSPTPYDPPLTYSGWVHSRALGARIGEILRERLLEDGVSDLANGDRPKSRRFKVVIHSSPFLRCVQTSTAISAGLASNPAPLQSPSPLPRRTSDSPSPSPGSSPKASTTLAPRSSASSPRTRPETAPRQLHSSSSSRSNGEKEARNGGGIAKTVLRLDAFLGEWMTPSYFELITPPPGSVMMVASAKAELLRRENYNIYPHFQTHVHSNSSSQLWNASPRPTTLASRIPDENAPSSTASALDGMADMAGSLPKSNGLVSNGTDPAQNGSLRVPPVLNGGPVGGTFGSGYVAPVPNYALSSKAPIPAGYVAHARDACVDVDYQWDSMREPYDWGSGGEYGEEWTSMHRRFRKGLQRLVGWYATAESPTDMVTKTVRFPASGPGEDSECAIDDSDDTETESVVILVSHGAGCNALIGAITHQPVLMEVGVSSLTMAVRKPGKETILHGSASSPAASNGLQGSARDTLPIHQYYDLRLFASTEHVRSLAPTPSSSRSPSMASAMGSRGRHSNSLSAAFNSNGYSESGANRSTSANGPLGSPRRSSAFNSSSLPRISGGITVGSGMTSFTNPSRVSRTPSMGLWSPTRWEDEEEDDTEMLLNFEHEKQAPVANADDVIAPTDLDSLGDLGEKKAPLEESPTAAEKLEQLDKLPQLGLGAGGLWGSPRPPGEAERQRDMSSTKRRWTVNARGPVT